MIEQPATVPTRLPPQPGLAIPIAWRSASTTNAGLAALNTEYLRIPAAIRSAFEVAHRGPDYMGSPLQQFKVYAGTQDDMFDQFGHGFGRSVGDPNWAGLYYGLATWLESAYSTGVITSYAATVTIVHEFGHHVDHLHHKLWPGSTDTQRLTQTAPFTALWAQVSAAIPSALYGATSIGEWFAELWRVQIQGDAATFLQLAGNDATAATAIRALFTDRLPMPALTGY